MFLNLQEVCHLVSVKEILKWDYSKECYKLDFCVLLQSWLWPGSALQIKYNPGRKTSEIVIKLPHGSLLLSQFFLPCGTRHLKPSLMFNLQLWLFKKNSYCDTPRKLDFSFSGRLLRSSFNPGSSSFSQRENTVSDLTVYNFNAPLKKNLLCHKTSSC